MTILRCPKCGSSDFDFITVYEQGGRATILNGTWDGIESCDAGEQGMQINHRAECHRCGHEWKPTKVKNVGDFPEPEHGRHE